ncbi:MAG: hypothetical protein JXM69_17860 [Anaerolineae bacterium]|nr:hypothetical protein [Anaerolineae bacterium]
MDQGWAGGLAVFSLVIPLGWNWLKNKTKDARWQNLEQRWLGRAAEFFYMVGLPYLAMVSGLLAPSFLGLKGLAYFSLVSSNLLGSELPNVMALIMLEWLGDGRAIIITGLIALLVLAGITWELARSGIVEATSSVSVIDTIYHTVHGAFYWALFWLMTDDLYLGVVFGTGWTILEKMLISKLQQNRFFQQPQLLLEVIILILGATIFFYRPNLWLLWPVHLAMVGLVRIIQMAVNGPKQSGMARSE